MDLKIKKESETAIIPTRATPDSAGLDLYSDEDNMLPTNSYRMFTTGISMAIPPGYEGQIRPRSGLAAKNGITVLNSPGTIDHGFRGVIKVILINHGSAPYYINKGHRIAQLVIVKVEQPDLVEVDQLDETERGSGGFGSTGK